MLVHGSHSVRSRERRVMCDVSTFHNLHHIGLAAACLTLVAVMNMEACDFSVLWSMTDHIDVGYEKEE